MAHFDLANMYGPPNGSPEETFGQILGRDFHARHELVHFNEGRLRNVAWARWRAGDSRKHLVTSIDDSLKRPSLDYVDIFYAHRPWPDVPIDETMSALAHIVKEARHCMWASPPSVLNTRLD